MKQIVIQKLIGILMVILLIVQYTDQTFAERRKYQYGTVNSYIIKSDDDRMIRMEGFQLDEKYSPNASKINEKLKETDVEELEKSALFFKCPSKYNSKSVEVRDVRILNGQYLLIDHEGNVENDVTGYLFGYELVFDLKSGEKLTIRDFFQGTEEDFKILVAETVQREKYAEVKAWEEANPGKQPLYTIDEIYNDAYDQAGFDSYIKFESEGVFIIYDGDSLIWNEYDAFISYKDLLGRTELSRDCTQIG